MFVAESIEDVLKPKTEKDINQNLDQIIDDFVNQTTFKDFLKSFNNIKEWQGGLHFNRGFMRKLKKGDQNFFLMDRDSLFNIVDDLASAFKFDEPLISDIDKAMQNQDYEASYKFPEFNKFWTEFLHMNRDLNRNNYDYAVNRVLEKIAQKFNVEY